MEMVLEKAFPEKYASKYSMVTFQEDMPYSKAMRIGRAQDKAILNMISDKELDLSMDLGELLKKVEEETREILEEDRLAKTMKH